MYYRHLKQLEHNKKWFVSSEFAELTGQSASQIRQDMFLFGGKGKQSLGYSVPELRQHIEHLLGIDRPHSMIIIGAGNLGCSIAHCLPYQQKGFSVIGVFDFNPCKIGSKVGDFTVKSTDDLDSFISQHPVDIAVLTLPASDAQALAKQLYAVGIRGFWNFAPVDLQLAEDATVVDVHLEYSLEMLSYYMCHMDT